MIWMAKGSKRNQLADWSTMECSLRAASLFPSFTFCFLHTISVFFHAAYTQSKNLHYSSFQKSLLHQGLISGASSSQQVPVDPSIEIWSLFQALMIMVGCDLTGRTQVGRSAILYSFGEHFWALGQMGFEHWLCFVQFGFPFLTLHILMLLYASCIYLRVGLNPFSFTHLNADVSIWLKHPQLLL